MQTDKLLATPSDAGYPLGSCLLQVFDSFEEGFGVHLLKCSLISELHDFVQALIKGIIK